jgi:hypothetical protein
LIQVSSRIPLLIPLAILPQRTLEIMDREEELLRGPLVQGAEDAVMTYESLEFPAEGMPLDPICCNLVS